MLARKFIAAHVTWLQLLSILIFQPIAKAKITDYLYPFKTPTGDVAYGVPISTSKNGKAWHLVYYDESLGKRAQARIHTTSLLGKGVPIEKNPIFVNYQNAMLNTPKSVYEQLKRAIESEQPFEAKTPYSDSLSVSWFDRIYLIDSEDSKNAYGVLRGINGDQFKMSYYEEKSASVKNINISRQEIGNKGFPFHHNDSFQRYFNILTNSREFLNYELKLEMTRLRRQDDDASLHRPKTVIGLSDSSIASPSSASSSSSSSSSSEISEEVSPKGNLGLLSHKVNLSRYPKNIRKHDSADELTIGDLHGSTKKLLFFLIQEGVLELGTSPTESGKIFSELKSIYNAAGADAHGNIDVTSIERFKTLIYSSTIKHPVPTLRFIGDELSDRGRNDIFTLIVFDRLHMAQVPYEILLSNHGLEFINFYETYLTGKQPQYRNEMPTDHGQIRSLMQLYALLGKMRTQDRSQLVSYLKEMVENAYLPHLKLISYSDDTDRQLTYYSHAPTGLESIPKLTGALGVKCGKERNYTHVEPLKACIDQINKKFELLRDLQGITHQVATEGGIGNTKGAFNYVTWSRTREGYYRDHTDLLEDGTRIMYAAGHDGGKPSKNGNIFCLDNKLGKGRGASKGEYSIYHSRKSSTFHLEEKAQ